MSGDIGWLSGNDRRALDSDDHTRKKSKLNMSLLSDVTLIDCVEDRRLLAHGLHEALGESLVFSFTGHKVRSLHRLGVLQEVP